MKQQLKYLQQHQPKIAHRLSILAERGTIRFEKQSHRQVRHEGPLFWWGRWLFGVSPNGRLNPIKTASGRWYSPAEHEERGTMPWGQIAEAALL